MFCTFCCSQNALWNQQFLPVLFACCFEAGMLPKTHGGETTWAVKDSSPVQYSGLWWWRVICNANGFVSSIIKLRQKTSYKLYHKLFIKFSTIKVVVLVLSNTNSMAYNTESHDRILIRNCAFRIRCLPWHCQSSCVTVLSPVGSYV